MTVGVPLPYPAAAVFDGVLDGFGGESDAPLRSITGTTSRPAFSGLVNNLARCQVGIATLDHVDAVELAQRYHVCQDYRQSWCKNNVR